MDVTMIMFKADGKRREFPLRKPRIVVGRNNSCDLRIPLSSVSREHCEILIADDKIKVKDLGSSNGTYLNNNRIKEKMLEAGDELSIGRVVFTLVVDGEPDAVEPVRSMIEKPASGNGKRRSSADESDLGSELSETPVKSPIESSFGSATVQLDSDDSSFDLDDPIAALESMDDASDASGSSEIPGLSEENDESR